MKVDIDDIAKSVSKLKENVEDVTNYVARMRGEQQVICAIWNSDSGKAFADKLDAIVHAPEYREYAHQVCVLEEIKDAFLKAKEQVKLSSRRLILYNAIVTCEPKENKTDLGSQVRTILKQLCETLKDCLDTTQQAIEALKSAWSDGDEEPLVGILEACTQHYSNVAKVYEHYAQPKLGG